MENEILISAKNIGQYFEINGKRQKVLAEINLEVKKGQFVCIVGPSGCGKSTLLRIIANLIKPSNGSVETKSGVKPAMVFQNFALFPWLTVEENIGFGLKMNNVSAEKIRHVVHRELKDMELSGVESKHPKELSGGMKQRVGIARALSMEPEILLLDEPFSSLDVFTANKLRDDLLAIWKERQLSILMVSHLVEEAVKLADEVLVMSANPGKINEKVAINLSRPRNERSEDFYRLVDKITKII